MKNLTDEKTIKRMETYARFANLLDKNDLTPYKVSKGTGIATATLSDWKNGKSMPKEDKIKKIAAFLDVDYEYIMTGNEPEFDYLYKNENTEFLIEVTRKAKNNEFVERMMKYMSLTDENRKSIDDMIDFMYEKEKKDEN